MWFSFLYIVISHHYKKCNVKLKLSFQKYLWPCVVFFFFLKKGCFYTYLMLGTEWFDGVIHRVQVLAAFRVLCFRRYDYTWYLYIWYIMEVSGANCKCLNMWRLILIFSGGFWKEKRTITDCDLYIDQGCEDYWLCFYTWVTRYDVLEFQYVSDCDLFLDLGMTFCDCDLFIDLWRQWLTLIDLWRHWLWLWMTYDVSDRPVTPNYWL